MITCSMCGFDCFTERQFLGHLKLLHANSADFYLVCGKSGCLNSFKNFNSYRTHLSRKHANVKGYRSTRTLKCHYCDLKFISRRAVVMHLKKHIDEQIKVKCLFDSCDCQFRIHSSLRAHISRKHKLEIDKINPIWLELQEIENLDTDSDNDCSDKIADSLPLEEDICASPDFTSNFMKQVALLGVKLEAKNLIPASSVQEIFNDFKSLFELNHEFYKHQIKSVFQQNSVSEEIMNHIINSIENHPYEITDTSLNSQFRRQKFVKEHFPTVEPTSCVLGFDEFNLRKCTYQYVPLMETLSQLLLHDDILNSVFGIQDETPEVLADYTDGLHYKSNEMVTGNDKVLSLLFYYDEFEVVNPIGAHRKVHKLGALYFILGNVPIENRSCLHVMQLSILCKVKHIKQFGLAEVFKPVLKDLKLLESEGIELKGHGKIKGFVSYFSADNLGSHFLGGFQECFSSNMLRICRFCLATSESIQNCFEIDKFEIRNEENYTYHCEQALQDPSLMSTYGVKRNSCLNELQFFHVTKGLPPDVMHDMLEGIVPYELALCLKKFIQNGYFTLDYINEQIGKFDYKGNDANNKPVEIPKKFKTKIINNAARTWCLLRIFPLLVGHKVPVQCIYWNFLLHLRKLAETIFALELSIGQVAALYSDIQDHLQMFTELFPEHKLKPKHHYMLHYPDLILKFGPLIRCWCMRFEAKHNYFKEIAKRTKCFKNIDLTLARKHQQLQCYHLSSANHYLHSDRKTSNLMPMQIEKYSKDVQDWLLFQKFNNQPVCKQVTIKGTKYVVGCFIPMHFKNDALILGKIVSIIISSLRSHFIVKKFTTFSNDHFGSLIISPTGEECVTNPEEWISFYPLSGYHVLGETHIVLKHSLTEMH